MRLSLYRATPWLRFGWRFSTLDEVRRLDVEYIDQWSFWLDLKILMKTFRVLLARNGAY